MEGQLSRAGSDLISTLISLKHAGAAFAAHRALQRLAEFCFDSIDPKIGKLPSVWTRRLLEEISEVERVRDSTLRRSTGFALGFLAIMRSEVASKADQQTLCPFVLAELLKLSLPPSQRILDYFEKIKLSRAFSNSAFPNLPLIFSCQNRPHEIRSRVHALNILRLIILDSPMAQEIIPFVGQVIISSIAGYTDEAWAVRNSSTMAFAAVMLRTIDADKNAANVGTTGNNSTTLGEVFKSYPNLSPFLNAVLSSADICDLGAQPTPPQFPILLLLSRVQPISISGQESREHGEHFIKGVFGCLLHRNYSIRRAASQAIANLCAGPSGHSVSSLPAMFSGCHRLLRDGVMRGDWDAVHGALMAIEELAGRFAEAANLLRNAGLIQYFLRVTRFEKLPSFLPPLCTAVALDIINSVSRLRNGGESWTQLLEENCEGAISILQAGSIPSDGSSALAVTAARVICCNLVPRVWDLTSAVECHRELSKLGSLLSSNSIDARLHACKSFKKSIYINIDELLANDSVTYDCRGSKLIAVCDTLVLAIEKELGRESADNIHPPTLRRLSRCLLECIGGHRTLHRSSAERLKTLPTKLTSSIEALAYRLLDQDKLANEPDFRCETPLSGNGLEMLSFVVAEHLHQSTEESVLSHLDEIQAFASIVKRLNDHNLSWRLRYSAAVSVENSKLLEYTGLNVTLKQIQHRLLEEVLLMLQDHDPDIRCVAGRAAQGMRRANESNPQKKFFVSLSELVLERTYEYVYSLSYAGDGASQHYAEHLLHGILGRCQELEAKLRMVQTELKNTESAGDTARLLNVGTGRKIFEDEIANPYEEPALANQLAFHSLLRLDLPTLSGPVLAIATQLIKQCQEMLSIVKTSSGECRAQDLLHDVTRFKWIFTEIHSLVVAVSVIIFIGGEGAENNQQVASDILSASDNDKLHPSVRMALQVLASAAPRNDETCRGVRQCLFLLPESM